MRILAVNCGSSSLKVVLFATGEHGAPHVMQRLAGGRVNHVGGQTQLHFAPGDSPETSSTVDVPDHATAMDRALDAFSDAGLLTDIAGIGHRIVHGGPHLTGSVLINGEVIDQIAAVSELAPLHNDAALAAIDAARRYLGATVPMVGVFDTAFHRHLPERAARYAIPPEMADEHGICRYGFHGLAHRFMAEQCASRMGKPLGALKLITLQLGGGCSATAIDGGRSIDTSMGFTPLEGLVMGTRSGDIDPAVVRFLCARTGMRVREVEQWLNQASGLLGVSGRSADVSELIEHESQGDRRAALALEMFCYRLRKYIGGYMAALAGVDAIVFGGGIGENAAEIRARTCRGMTWCGLILDEERNHDMGSQAGEISADDSKIKAYVIPVDEEILIARDTYDCLSSPRTERGSHR